MSSGNIYKGRESDYTGTGASDKQRTLCFSDHSNDNCAAEHSDSYSKTVAYIPSDPEIRIEIQIIKRTILDFKFCICL